MNNKLKKIHFEIFIGVELMMFICDFRSSLFVRNKFPDDHKLSLEKVEIKTKNKCSLKVLKPAQPDFLGKSYSRSFHFITNLTNVFMFTSTLITGLTIEV